jgi:alpha-beta hydrolase superfamily lysophospholipase
MWKWETEYEPKGVVVVIHDMLEHHEYYTGLISQLRNANYHVVTGDLPGHGQTTRVHKGHITDFYQYIDRVMEWFEMTRGYRLPTFIIGQGLGGLIAIELIKQHNIHIDGVALLNPLLSFKQSFMNRKNTLITSVRTSSDETRFNPGIKMKYFTTDETYLERYENDELIVDRVSYHWYKTIINQMKNTSGDMDEFPDVPLLSIFTEGNEIIEPFISSNYVKKVSNKELQVIMLDGADHGIFQREDIEVPFYHLEKFFDSQLFRIGLL